MTQPRDTADVINTRGTAATRDVQTIPTDVTPGRLLAVGAFGLGSNVIEKTTGSVNDLIDTFSARYNIATAVSDAPSTMPSGYRCEYYHRSATEGHMVAYSNLDNSVATQRVSSGTAQGWSPVYTGVNFQPDLVNGIGVAKRLRNLSGAGIASGVTTTGDNLLEYTSDTLGSFVTTNALNVAHTYMNTMGITIDNGRVGDFVRIS